MNILQLIIFALIQGITEWLPVSSSGHNLLAAELFNWTTRDELMINAMAHLGTLFAVLLYFWKDVARAISGGFQLVGAFATKKPLSGDARLALLILASMPITFAAIVVYEALITDAAESALRSMWTVAGSTLIFGFLLWWADVKGKTTRSTDDMSITEALIIGATQAIAAIIPGTSRSGITMTAARWFGFERTEAARFAMLIGAPILAAVGTFAILKLVTADDAAGTATLTDGLIVAGLSFVSGWASIAVLMELLKRMSFLPFVIYRILLAVVLVLASPLALNWIPA